jgi:hypothetical protein
MAFNFPDNPVLNDVYTSSGVSYGWDGVVWSLVETPILPEFGDLKSCLQPADHVGWVLFDGRLISDLPPNQAIQASNFFGAATNLPNANDAALIMKSGTLGTVAGSHLKKISVAQLPAHN